MSLGKLIVDESVKQTLLERWSNMRSFQRIDSKVKLLVEYEDGKDCQRANAVTVDVSNSGCKAVVGADLYMHQRVRLIHAQSGRKVDAQVVWRGHEAWDAGFALEQPDADFWE